MNVHTFYWIWRKCVKNAKNVDLKGNQSVGFSWKKVSKVKIIKTFSTWKIFLIFIFLNFGFYGSNFIDQYHLAWPANRAKWRKFIAGNPTISLPVVSRKAIGVELLKYFVDIMAHMCCGRCESNNTVTVKMLDRVIILGQGEIFPTSRRPNTIRFVRVHICANRKINLFVCRNRTSAVSRFGDFFFSENNNSEMWYSISLRQVMQKGNTSLFLS